MEEELLLGDPEVDLGGDSRDPVDEGRAEELAQRDRIMLPRDRGDEALVEIDALELDAAAGAPVERVLGGALDRFDVYSASVTVS